MLIALLYWNIWVHKCTSLTQPPDGIPYGDGITNECSADVFQELNNANRGCCDQYTALTFRALFSAKKYSEWEKI